ncbi:MAG TPA: hypothetical protein VJZ27_03305, partial [Aggregatilineales bacterium]|nr:hypothetical protein [Aggregatilineales bacterium]
MKTVIRSSLLLMLLYVTTAAYAQNPPPRANDCLTGGYLAPRLVGGMMARVTPGGVANRVRADPNLNADIVFMADPGTPLYVTTSPACADGLVFWQVQFRDLNTANSGIEDFGWTGEGSSGEYWLEPVLQTWNIPPNRAFINTASAARMQNLGQVMYGLVNNLAWSPNGTILAVNSVGAVWLHHVDSPGAAPVAIKPNQVDTNHTSDMVFTPLGNALITIGDSLQTWNIANGAQLSTESITLPVGGISAINATGTIAAVATDTGAINIYDLQTSQIVSTLTGHSLVQETVFHPNRNILVSGGGAGMTGSDNTVRLWDLSTGTQLAIFNAGQPVSHLAFSPDGSTLAIPVNLNLDQSQPPFPAVNLVDMQTFSVRSTINVA